MKKITLALMFALVMILSACSPEDVPDTVTEEMGTGYSSSSQLDEEGYSEKSDTEEFIEDSYYFSGNAYGDNNCWSYLRETLKELNDAGVAENYRTFVVENGNGEQVVYIVKGSQATPFELLSDMFNTLNREMYFVVSLRNGEVLVFTERGYTVKAYDGTFSKVTEFPEVWTDKVNMLDDVFNSRTDSFNDPSMNDWYVLDMTNGDKYRLVYYTYDTELEITDYVTEVCSWTELYSANDIVLVESFG